MGILLRDSLYEENTQKTEHRSSKNHSQHIIDFKRSMFLHQAPQIQFLNLNPPPFSFILGETLYSGNRPWVNHASPTRTVQSLLSLSISCLSMTQALAKSVCVCVWARHGLLPLYISCGEIMHPVLPHF